jgi:oxygen-independent coproporphyrinogen-3 oxidase
MLRGSLDPLLRGLPPVEFTAEMNPEDVDEPLLTCLKDIDVNRVSLGVQSMDAATQKKLQRCSPRINERAISLVRRYFDHINVDVLVGIPECGEGELRETMRTLDTFHPEHYSVYCLERSGGEELGSFAFWDGVDPEKAADEYLLVCDFLREHGYRHYEVSNFAVPDFESLHNLAYWSGDEYVGIGPGAHSFIGGRRYCTEPSLERYISSFAEGTTPARIYDDQDGDSLLEKVMLALRTDRGVPIEWIIDSTAIIDELVDRGLATTSGGRLFLSDRGYLLLDEIIVRICGESGGARRTRHPHARDLDS